MIRTFVLPSTTEPGFEPKRKFWRGEFHSRALARQWCRNANKGRHGVDWIGRAFILFADGTVEPVGWGKR